MEHPILPNKISRAAAVGEFKRAGSTDPDILEAVRERMLASSRAARLWAWVILIVGLMLIVTIIGIPVAIIFVPMGLWSLSRARGNIRAVNEAYSQVAGTATAA